MTRGKTGAAFPHTTVEPPVAIFIGLERSMLSSGSIGQKVSAIVL